MSDGRISTEEFKQAVFENNESVVEAEWRGIQVKINRLLPLSGVLKFVDAVAESCFMADTGTYIPEIKDFAIRCCILTMYANFELPEDLEQKYNLVYASDAVSFVEERIDSSQFNQMMIAIDRKIEHRAQSNIEALNKQMNEVVAGFNALEETLGEVFRGIDGDTISKIADAISNGAFDENKLVQAIVNSKPHLVSKNSDSEA